jgi:hypothetical protein
LWVFAYDARASEKMIVFERRADGSKNFHRNGGRYGARFEV